MCKNKYKNKYVCMYVYIYVIAWLFLRTKLPWKVRQRIVDFNPYAPVMLFLSFVVEEDGVDSEKGLQEKMPVL